MIMSPWLKKHQWLFNDYIMKSKHLQVFQAQPPPHHPDMPSLVISSSSQGPVAFAICSSQLGVTFPSSSLTLVPPSSIYPTQSHIICFALLLLLLLLWFFIVTVNRLQCLAVVLISSPLIPPGVLSLPCCPYHPQG